MKQKLFSTMIATLLAMTLAAPCFATELQQPAVDLYAMSCVPTLSFKGTTANCKVVISSAGKQIDARLELWHGNTRLASWSDSAVSWLTISGTYPVVSGKTYTLKVFGTVGGSAITVTPVSGTC